MIAENIEKIKGRVTLACRRAGRDPEDVRLVAVSKTFPSTRIEEAVRSGVADIGENYIQELLEKREATLEAQVVTPLGTGEYLISKVATLTALSLVENLLLVAFAVGMRFALVPMALGIVLASVLYALMTLLILFASVILSKVFRGTSCKAAVS